jgi:NAD(P)-dependent dehydrogenase (short-subunit alcohol dehydrogenase family)
MHQGTEQLKAAGARVLAITCDVSKPEEVEAAVAQAVKTFGRIDCAFNNAGVENKAAPLHHMRDHLRQEKTGNLPSPLPEIARQQDFAAGTLGLWGPDHFVIYYSNGRVPQPGIVILGKVTGDISIFDRPGSIAIRVERANQ